MHEEAQEADGNALTSERWPALFSQLLPFALGLVAFELTANSMLGIALACLKFGGRSSSRVLAVYGRTPSGPGALL